jgi:hypothetical protein
VSDDNPEQPPTPEGQHCIDVAKLYGLYKAEEAEDDDDRWGPLGCLIFVLFLYFAVKLLVVVGGGYCKPNGQSAISKSSEPSPINPPRMTLN